MKHEKKDAEYSLKLRNLKISDFPQLERFSKEHYGEDEDAVWTLEEIAILTKIFSKGQICIEDHGIPIAFALSIIVDERTIKKYQTYDEVTSKGFFSRHNPNGNILYGLEIIVDPEYQGMKLGRRLYDARKELCEKLNLKAIIAGGRMPNYHKYAPKLKPKEYIDKVKKKEINDPVLAFQLSNDFHVKRVLSKYLPVDGESQAYATLIEWNNIYYDEEEKIIGGEKETARIGLVQWEMRSFKSLEAFYETLEFFVKSASYYHADFLLLPELFNGALMAQFNLESAAQAIRKLATYTEEIKDKMVQFAVEYNVNIIGGSLPYYKKEELTNVAYLCRRNGTWDLQKKIHITPAEKIHWGVVGGNKIKIFDTDVARIGILICYDVEFPELSRILAKKGMQILFVPFAADTKNSYQRIRICSQARAIENECYVAIAGCVGNIPNVKMMDIHYAQSAIFAPADFAFPHDSIVTEGPPNAETVIVADVDLDILKELHNYGTVTNLKDRRTDIYEIRLKR